MPDLATRSQHEVRIATAMFLLMGNWRNDILAGDRFNVSRFADDMSDALFDPLAAVHRDASTNLATAQGVNLDRWNPDVRSDRWATRYGRQIGREVAASVRDELAIARRLRDPLEQNAEIARIFGRTRAEAVGITETTRSISSGERDVLDEIERQTGETLLAYWQTEASGVCKICRGLRNKSASVWRAIFPMGPPAHPWCRCWLEYRARRRRRIP